MISFNETMMNHTLLINFFLFLVSILLSIPHAYYRIIEKFDETNETSVCMDSRDLKLVVIDIDNFELSIDQILLLYTFVIAYVIPLISIATCYIIMFFKLNSSNPEVTIH
jgi:hypothetical protein